MMWLKRRGEEQSEVRDAVRPLAVLYRKVPGEGKLPGRGLGLA